MTSRRHALLKLLVVSLLSTTLLACNGQKTANADIHHFIQEVKQRFEEKQTKPAHIKQVPKSSYTSSSLRSPFERPEARNKLTKQYKNVILRSYTLESLSITGIIVSKKQSWAIIKTPDGKLTRITQGSRVGASQALVTNITKTQVQFTKEIGTQFGTKEKVITLDVNAGQKQPDES